MKIQEIREIIRLIDQSSIEEFTFENDGTKVQLKKTGTAAAPVQTPVQAVAAPVQEAPAAALQTEAQPPQPKEAPSAAETKDSSLHQVVSPMVGTFYQSPSPEEAAYVQVGSRVTKDSVVCIVEAMKLFNEIEAEVDGEIAEILVKDGQLVEYGQPLFLVKTK